MKKTTKSVAVLSASQYYLAQHLFTQIPQVL